ncbi:MAG: MoxR family ATPase, partial [Saprospiraceae bacterium]|nr:MoxR family ATPase [Saprospiraceae bacterium]
MTNEEHLDPSEENLESENPSSVPSAGQVNLSPTREVIDVSKVENIYSKVNNELKKVIIGQQDLIDQLLLGLLSGGHVLVEGVPGIAKTLTAKLLAKTLDIDFSRIQFTPDLMPSDVLGTNVFNLKTSEFSFNKGPVFSNIILIDEINRSPAKTQAALFEVMEEYQITVDGQTYELDLPFFVMATQNPIEQEGTYKLPEAQLDRFIFKINIGHPSLEEERAILRRFKNDFNLGAAKEVKAVFKAKDILEARAVIEKVYIQDSLLDYIAALVYQTRTSGDLYLGASPRASIALMKASKAMAAMNGRDYVIPDDVRYVSFPVLNHRILLTPEREMEGMEV